MFFLVLGVLEETGELLHEVAHGLGVGLLDLAEQLLVELVDRRAAKATSDVVARIVPTPILVAAQRRVRAPPHAARP